MRRILLMPSVAEVGMGVAAARTAEAVDFMAVVAADSTVAAEVVSTVVAEAGGHPAADSARAAGHAAVFRAAVSVERNRAARRG